MSFLRVCLWSLTEPELKGIGDGKLQGTGAQWQQSGRRCFFLFALYL